MLKNWYGPVCDACGDPGILDNHMYPACPDCLGFARDAGVSRADVRFLFWMLWNIGFDPSALDD